MHTLQQLLGVEDRVRLTSQYAVDACMQSLGYYGAQRKKEKKRCLQRAGVS
jgi:hypothetical protein